MLNILVVTSIKSNPLDNEKAIELRMFWLIDSIAIYINATVSSIAIICICISTTSLSRGGSGLKFIGVNIVWAAL